MLSKFGHFFKRILTSFLMLYGYNILVPSTAIIPINFITVLVIAFLSVPGMIILIVIRLLIY